MRGIDVLRKNRIILLNGATGTNLLDKGLAPGESPSILNIRNPQEVYNVQHAYVEAGSEIILTNTFSANQYTIPIRQLDGVLRAGVTIATRAAGNKAIVYGDIGPLGVLVRPYGELPFEDAFEKFHHIARVLSRRGVGGFFIETFTSMIEAKAAFLAVRELSRDIFVCFSLQDNGKTIMGEIPESIAVTFEALGASALGINCTMPEVAIEGLQRMAKVTDLPLVIKPNAGKVKIKGTKIQHSLSDDDMALLYERFVKAGARFVGGCCGTTPAFIKKIRHRSRKVHRQRAARIFTLASPERICPVAVPTTVIIGERLNPSGRKKVKASLQRGDFSVYGEEAKAQDAAGADVLDVNAFLVDLDEKNTLEQAVYAVLKNAHTPISIDTQDFEAAKRILSWYPGIGVYNSIPAQSAALKKWLPMVRQYGFKAVISLIGKRIPRSVGERVENAKLALSVARRVGFPEHDLIFDPLVFAAATEQPQVECTLKTVKLLARRGLKTILGISNVSFGLPHRSQLNAVLAASAVQHGVTFLIVNPMDSNVMSSVTAAKALFKGDVAQLCALKIEEPAAHIQQMYERVKAHTGDLMSAIIEGNGAEAVEFAGRLLKKGISPQDIIDKHIAQALHQVGSYYESGRYFIPDLLRAADASKKVIALVKRFLPRSEKRGTVVLATVKGDIHDIGKNIAGMIFESAGYGVIDLGKDVDTEKIISTLRKHNPIALGLSALLTTTMSEMEQVVRRLERENMRTKVIIGGPNVSKQYAKRIGAYGAARNALEGLRLLKSIKK